MSHETVARVGDDVGVGDVAGGRDERSAIRGVPAVLMIWIDGFELTKMQVIEPPSARVRFDGRAVASAVVPRPVALQSMSVRSQPATAVSVTE